MKKVYKLENLCCANCAAEIENAVCKIEGITGAALSFMTGRLAVEFEGEEAEMKEKIVKVCHYVEPECVIK